MTKKGKINLIIAGVIVLVIIGGWWFYSHQKNTNICKDECRYSPTAPVWVYDEEDKPNKIFETQDQCVDYCLRR